MRLVSLVGTSPGVLHTTLCKLLEEGEIDPDELEEVLVVSTLEQQAREALEIAGSCPCPATGKPPLPADAKAAIHLLPYSDIDSQQRLADLRKKLATLIQPGDIVDATGGRKAMSIAAAVEATAKGARVVMTHIPPETYREVAGETEPCRKTRPQEAVLLRF